MVEFSAPRVAREVPLLVTTYDHNLVPDSVTGMSCPPLLHVFQPYPPLIPPLQKVGIRTVSHTVKSTGKEQMGLVDLTGARPHCPVGQLRPRQEVYSVEDHTGV